MDSTLTQVLAALYASDALAHQAQQRVAELESENADLKTRLFQLQTGELLPGWHLVKDGAE
jgi:uncharacterized protein YceH (UPF0502 family)